MTESLTKGNDEPRSPSLHLLMLKIKGMHFKEPSNGPQSRLYIDQQVYSKSQLRSASCSEAIAFFQQPIISGNFSFLYS